MIVKKVQKIIFENVLLLAIILISAILRLTNLGYSDFQGDEIKALFLPDSGQNIWEYLLDQRKGPLQFLITFGLKFIDPLYQNQLLLRLPFAIAGILAVYFFYKLISDIFDKKTAFYASFLFATNGFLIAFSRIVQYQSFVIMFMIASLYLLRKKQIYLGLIFWALSILFHYDGIFIFPLAFYYIFRYLVDTTDLKPKETIIKNKVKISKTNLINFISAGIIATLLLALFYVPFVLNISKDTQQYWAQRISGSVSDKVSSSIYLFRIYQPIYVIYVYVSLFFIGVGALLLKNVYKIGVLPKFFKNLFNEFSILKDYKELIFLFEISSRYRNHTFHQQLLQILL
mgnify:CR=1 FL=1